VISLGISCNYHDSAACLVVDGRPVAAAEEERFSRIKHDASFPASAIDYCLSQAGITAADLDAITFYEKPARKLERLLKTARLYMPQSATLVAEQFAPLVRDGLCIEDTIRERLAYSGAIYFCEHHLSHAASAFYVSPFTEAAVLVVDGVGEWATCTRFSGTPEGVQKLSEIHYPHSLGLLYSMLTAFLGFAVNDDEYKVMGLASYGAPTYRKALDTLLTRHADGSFSLNLDYVSYMYDRKSMYTEALEQLLGPARRSQEPITQRHQDIAASLQALTEDVMVGLADASLAVPSAGNLCLAGGVAYNCVSNTKVAARVGFDKIFIQPAAGDSGAAMGAALWTSHNILGEPRQTPRHHSLLGPEFGNDEIAERLQAFGLSFERLAADTLCQRVASLILADMVVGWFQGRMEFGPRALGARSILANPRNADMKDILNARVKFREEFRPFAPAVLEEEASKYFDIPGPSPFMLLTPKVHNGRRREIPSVTHIDGTARVQTVSRQDQPLFHQLISCFGVMSGTPIVINTSFNIRGEPIVCTPDDAIKCFLGTEIDFLAIGDLLVSKV